MPQRGDTNARQLSDDRLANVQFQASIDGDNR